ncbi:hypothetical protein AGMMS49983_01250 [Clostridia bacterium]|nr:hypothetical protein AGMMS49983_01250 [Clostridia bacterium]
MKSAVAITYELDDAAVAAGQLADSIREKLTLLKHSVGILLCDADMDGATVTAKLQDLLGVEVAGMTTLATLDPDGHHEAAACLTVLTADDCGFFTGVSESLRAGDFRKKITGAYQQAGSAAAAGGFGGNPGLVFVFCPYGMPFSGDRYPDVLSEASCDAPIIGGVASDDYDYERARVFCTGQEYRDAMVLISVWGAVKPAFAMRHVTSRFAERIRRVVEAEGNVVYRVGDETFVEYLEGFGLKTDVEDPLLAFNSYPMMLTQEGGDETPLMRHIFALDHETGIGSFLGDVPTGTLANICLVNKEDIISACRISAKDLLAARDLQPDYEYSTVLCFSCCGRAMILGKEGDAEGLVLKELLPADLKLAGAYCLGEICPVRHQDGKATSRFHNCSFTLCMI